MEKFCRWCGQTKEIFDFYVHNGMADGHMNKCKECQKKNTRETRKNNYEYYKEYDKKRAMLPHRVKARAEYSKTDAWKASRLRTTRKWVESHPNRRAASVILNNALRDGKVQRLPCFICGEKAHAHHPDYDRPLDVVWLCPKHHKEAHRNT